jgi:hypothetical protein
MGIPGLAYGGSWAMGVATGVSPVFNPLIPALISGLLAGLLEEFGWTGLAFPALQARFGFLRAGATVGVIIAVWHLPFFLLPGTTQNASSFVMFLAILVPARIVFGWVYNGSGGSVLLAILLHARERMGRGSKPGARRGNRQRRSLDPDRRNHPRRPGRGLHHPATGSPDRRGAAMTRLPTSPQRHAVHPSDIPRSELTSSTSPP